MDLTKAAYEQLGDGRSVRVKGTTFVRSRSRDEAYTVKLEGGKVTGFRTLFIGSYCDPILIGQLDELLSWNKRLCQNAAQTRDRVLGH